MNALHASESAMTKLAQNKSLLKEYSTSLSSRTVYMNDGVEFEIQLFNPTQHRIGAEVFINGDSLGNIVILCPGERLWLERYLTEPKKFKFSTYEVDDSAETATAIMKNGEIIVKYYEEIVPSSPLHIQHTTWTAWMNGQPYIEGTPKNANFNMPGRSTGVVDYDNFCTTASAVNTTFFSSAYAHEDAIAGKDSEATCSHASSPNYDIVDTIETGRVESGSGSSQRFDYTDITLSSWPWKTDTLLILPASRKPLEAKDLTRVYCPHCGKKLSHKFKFCPQCGEKI